jgi:hypothetical protein
LLAAFAGMLVLTFGSRWQVEMAKHLKELS